MNHFPFGSGYGWKAQAIVLGLVLLLAVPVVRFSIAFIDAADEHRKRDGACALVLDTDTPAGTYTHDQIMTCDARLRSGWGFLNHLPSSDQGEVDAQMKALDRAVAEWKQRHN